MNRVLQIGLTVLGLTLGAAPTWAAAAETPEGTLVEAEDAPGAGSYGQVVDDADASAGKAVTSGAAYHPLFRYDIDDELPDRLELWVRHKGGPLQLKFKVDGSTKEITWKWNKPAEYTWTSFGEYDRASMGRQAPHVDAVVFGPVEAEPGSTQTPQNAGEAGIAATAAEGTVIPPAVPDDALSIIDATVMIDWSADAGELTRDHWGIALFHPVNGKAADDTGLSSFLTTAAPGLVRLHRADQGKLWQNPDKLRFDDGLPAWDVDTIRRALAPVQAVRDAGVDVRLMLNHGYWPTWFADGKRVDPKLYDQAAALSRELVAAVAETGVRVDYWEILNEADNTYEKEASIEEMCDLFLVMADAVRSAAPGAQVGGAAFTWAKPAWVEPFLDRCGDRIDFISWHNYAGGKPTVPNETLFAQVPKIAGHLDYVKKQLARRGMSDLGMYLTEFNVQWTWQPYERRHANNVGAVFMASAITELARGGIDGVTMWHAKGNAYGLIDSEDRLRATGQLYQLGSQMTGRVGSADVQFDSIDPAKDGPQLKSIPIRGEAGERSLLLINQHEATVRVRLASEADAWPAEYATIDAEGLHRVELEPGSAGGLELPGWSVTLLVDRDLNLPRGRTVLPGQHIAFDF